MFATSVVAALLLGFASDPKFAARLGFVIDTKCACSADEYLRGGEKKCDKKQQCGRDEQTADMPFCVGTGKGCHGDVMKRCRAGKVGDYCDSDDSCMPGRQCTKFRPAMMVTCDDDEPVVKELDYSKMSKSEKDRLDTKVDEANANGQISLGFGLNVSGTCDPADSGSEAGCADGHTCVCPPDDMGVQVEECLCMTAIDAETGKELAIEYRDAKATYKDLCALTRAKTTAEIAALAASGGTFTIAVLSYAFVYTQAVAALQAAGGAAAASLAAGVAFKEAAILAAGTIWPVAAVSGPIFIGIAALVGGWEICKAGTHPTCQLCEDEANCAHTRWALPDASCEDDTLNFCTDDSDKVMRAYCCANPKCTGRMECGGLDYCACPEPKGISCDEDSDCVETAEGLIAGAGKRYCSKARQDGKAISKKYCYDGADGDSCDNDEQCALNYGNYCQDGICYDGSRGDQCDTDADCQTYFPDNYCTHARGKVTSNRRCWAGAPGDACTNDDQCWGQTACVRGECRQGCGGDMCETESDCMADNPDNPHHSNDACKFDGGLKGRCRDAGCPGDTCSDDNECIGNTYCEKGKCYAGEAGDKCGSDSDCAMSGNYCMKDPVQKRCQSGCAGSKCSSDEQCARCGTYCDHGKCYEGKKGDRCSNGGDCKSGKCCRFGADQCC